MKLYPYFLRGLVVAMVIGGYILTHKKQPQEPKFYTGTVGPPSKPFDPSAQPEPNTLNGNIMLDAGTASIDPRNGQCVDWVAGVLQPSSADCVSATPKPPTLKQLLCKLDAECCRRHLQYKIMPFDPIGDEPVTWSAWAWPQGKDFQLFASYVENGGFNGWMSTDRNGQSSFESKEETVSALLRVLQYSENMICKHKPKEEPRKHLTPASTIYGPTNCDPHRQCQ